MKTFRKLGRLASRPDRRTMWLEKYLAPELPPPPEADDHTTKVTVPWGMLGNDVAGDCTIAAAAHMEMGWRFNAGAAFQPTQEQVLGDYTSLTGYDPNDPGTDNGAEPINVLKYWRTWGICQRKIGAFAAVNPKKVEQVKKTVELFGSAYVALALPSAAVDGPWTLPPDQQLVGDWQPWSGGGHMVECPKYDASGLWLVSWGELMPCGWTFFAAYCDECYAVLSRDLLDDRGLSPDGLDMDALSRDLDMVQRMKATR